MKNLFTFMAAVLLTASVFAQSPEKMSYQAVIRDDGGNLVAEQEIGMQISILQGTVDGTVVYSEVQTPTTNVNGLVSLEIGSESGFETIDWLDGPYFIETETDPDGGTNYTITGTSQLLSVPYALHAKTAETVTGNITETYEIGDEAHGGIVFYVEPCGTKGLVAATEDQSTGIKWRGGDTNYATMAKGSELYAGKMNTSIIIAVHSAKDDFDDHAALVAANYTGGDFGDWYLPSREELHLMYVNLHTQGLGSFPDELYWSSSESSANNAWPVFFGNGDMNAHNKSYASVYVRAVRAF